MDSIRHARETWAEFETWGRLTLAAIYQAAGRENEAEPILQEVVKYLEAEFYSGFRHPDSMFLLAQAYAFQGRDDEAMDMLRTAVDYHWRFSRRVMSQIEQESIFPWGRFRDDPRYIALVDHMQADLDHQTARVEVILAQHNVDDLLAPLRALVRDADPAEQKQNPVTPQFQ